MENQTFTVEQVAERFQVNPQTVYRWIYNGELQSFKVGNGVRITEPSIQKFIEDSSNILKKQG